MPRRFNLSVVAAIILLLVAGVGYYSAFVRAENTTQVVVARTTLVPFIAATSSEVEEVAVPKGSVGANDLTWAEYESTYAHPASGQSVPLIPTLTILQGQKLDTRELSTDNQTSFGIVLPDERVIAVTSTTAGAALGVIQPGDVVDVTTSGGSASGGSDGIVSQFAKVLCISSSDTGCRGVLAADQKLSISGSSGGLGSSSNSSSGAVKILLAVASSDASKFAGQSVSLSLNTFCGVDQTGHFVSLRGDQPCQAPPGRDASAAAKKPAKAANAGPSSPSHSASH